MSYYLIKIEIMNKTEGNKDSKISIQVHVKTLDEMKDDPKVIQVIWKVVNAVWCIGDRTAEILEDKGADKTK